MNNISYGISRIKWREIKENVLDNNMNNSSVRKKYGLNSKQIWFLYDVLLQGKYNHLYKRNNIVNPEVMDYVYCDYEEFGRGTIVSIHDNLMLVKFDKRDLNTMCGMNPYITVFDDVKRKITSL